MWKKNPNICFSKSIVLAILFITPYLPSKNPNKQKQRRKQTKPKLNNLTDTKTKRIPKISTISSPSSVAKYLTSKLNMFLFKKLSSILFKSFHILENNMNRQIKRNSYYYRYEAIRYLTLWFYSHKEIALVAVKMSRLNGDFIGILFFHIKITAASVCPL